MVNSNDECKSKGVDKRKMLIRRIVSVTSQLQLILALTCLKLNTRKDVYYCDYLLISSGHLTDDTVENIKKVAGVWDFHSVIDSRSSIDEFNMAWKKQPRLRRFIGGKYDITARIVDSLKKTVNEKLIDQIYLRYKFNLTEHILLNLFPKADVFIFEDGAGDYKTDIVLGNKRRMVSSVLCRIGNNSILGKFYRNELYSTRIKGRYELISDYAGTHKSQHIIEENGKGFTNIKIPFLQMLENIRKKFWPNIALSSYCHGSPVVLLLLHPFMKSSEVGYAKPSTFEIEERVELFNGVYCRLKNKFPCHKILIKTHPSTSPEILALLTQRFEHSLLGNLNEAPTEILFSDPNVEFVVSSSSSGMIYAVNLFDKKAYFILNVDDYINQVPEQDMAVLRDLCLRLGVEELDLQN